MRARYDGTQNKFAFLAVPLVLAGLYVLYSIFSYFQPVPAGQDGPYPAVHFLVLTPLMAIVTFLAASLLAILIGALAYAMGMRQWAMTHWAKFMVQRAWARLHDHRVWIVGIGLLAFLSSIGLFAVLPQQFQPTTNSAIAHRQLKISIGNEATIIGTPIKCETLQPMVRCSAR